MAKNRLVQEYGQALDEARKAFAGQYTSGTATQLAASL